MAIYLERTGVQCKCPYCGKVNKVNPRTGKTASQRSACAHVDEVYPPKWNGGKWGWKFEKE